jgi:hypothetical protein
MVADLVTITSFISLGSLPTRAQAESIVPFRLSILSEIFAIEEQLSCLDLFLHSYLLSSTSFGLGRSRTKWLRKHYRIWLKNQNQKFDLLQTNKTLKISVYEFFCQHKSDQSEIFWQFCYPLGGCSLNNSFLALIGRNRCRQMVNI